MAKVVLYDRRPGSPTEGKVEEHFLGDHNRTLLVIPPGVLHGMKGVSPGPAFLINTPTHPYNYGEPDEFRVHPHENDIPYDWDRKDG
jgi:dTDP-4-dehydrorhamnose 3,5-epimerase